MLDFGRQFFLQKIDIFLRVSPYLRVIQYEDGVKKSFFKKIFLFRKINIILHRFLKQIQITN
jgi:hypothetical protein